MKESRIQNFIYKWIWARFLKNAAFGVLISFAFLENVSVLSVISLINMFYYLNLNNENFFLRKKPDPPAFLKVRIHLQSGRHLFMEWVAHGIGSLMIFSSVFNIYSKWIHMCVCEREMYIRVYIYMCTCMCGYLCVCVCRQGVNK